MINSDTLLTIHEAANILKVHWQSVRRYIKDKRLNSFKVGRSIRISSNDLQAFINSTKNNRKVEIEIRFALKDTRRIERRLMELGANIIYHAHVIDHWYVPKSIRSMQQKNEWFDTALGYGLRIREQDNGYTGKITTSLEVKRLLEPYKHETCIEQEISVNNYKETHDLLKLADFKEFTTLDKERLIFQYLDCKVVIDKIKDFDQAVEIEKVTDEDNSKTIKRLRYIAKRIGLDIKNEITNKSVTYMYMKKHSRF